MCSSFFKIVISKLYFDIFFCFRYVDPWREVYKMISTNLGVTCTVTTSETRVPARDTILKKTKINMCTGIYTLVCYHSHSCTKLCLT